jgi:hypothetical protein
MTNMTSNKPFRVLCIDGGGMRGLYTASVLDTLVKRFHNGKTTDIGSEFDLIVGTSTGGLLAIGLAYGLSTEEIVQLYRTQGKHIFPNPIPKTGGWKKMLLWLGARENMAQKGHEALKKALADKFGETTIEQLYAKRDIGICIPTVRMETRKAWVFKTPHLAGKTRDNKYKLVDVCLATSAAPLILPLVAIASPDDKERYDTFTDGGLWANNPVMIGLIEALELAHVDSPIQILSVGTAEPPAGRTIAQDNLNWGVGVEEWKAGVGIVETAIDSQVSGAVFMAAKIQPYLKHSTRIIRLEHTPPSSEQVNYVALDRADDSALKALTDMGKSDAEMIHSKCLSHNNGDLAIVKEIFEQSKPFK